MRTDPRAEAFARVVVDTNVLLSAALLADSAPAKLVRTILLRGRLVFTPETFAEFESRLWKPKFDRYISIEDRKLLLHDFNAAAIWPEVSIDLLGREFSRDPDDDKFVHAALAAGARRLVTGDEDLLVLGKIETVNIVTPRMALKELG